MFGVLILYHGIRQKVNLFYRLFSISFFFYPFWLDFLFFILYIERCDSMPIRIQANLPAIEVSESENIFVMTHERANLQDIRPLKIAIFNLMPTKIETETQLLRLLSNSPLQVDVELLHTATHISKNTSSYHLNTFYKTFQDVKDQKFDGMIITGAPVEQLPFEEVDYWDEMSQIMEWSKSNVYSVLYTSAGALRQDSTITTGFPNILCRKNSAAFTITLCSTPTIP